MIEEWKEIEGYREYKISNTGKVINRHGDYIKQHYRKGYLRVSISNILGKRRALSVHRVVLTAFNPTEDSSLEVNHKDGIKDNNTLCNLEWCTRSQNAKHAYRLGLQHKRGTANGRSKLTEETVVEIREDKLKGASTKELAIKYGVSTSAINRANKRDKYWTHVK